MPLFFFSAAIDPDLSRAQMWAHGCSPPVVHRDLKPENVWVNAVADDREGRLMLTKIMDFGIALTLSPPPQDQDELLLQGQAQAPQQQSQQPQQQVSDGSGSGSGSRSGSGNSGRNGNGSGSGGGSGGGSGSGPRYRHLVGTRGYCAPEQAWAPYLHAMQQQQLLQQQQQQQEQAGRSVSVSVPASASASAPVATVDARADLWSVGAVLFQLAALAETLPFDSLALARQLHEYNNSQRSAAPAGSGIAGSGGSGVGAARPIGTGGAAGSAGAGGTGGAARGGGLRRPQAPSVVDHMAGPVRTLISEDMRNSYLL